MDNLLLPKSHELGPYLNAIRLENEVDIFASNLNCSYITHYWANPSTGWNYREEKLWYDNPLGRIAITRLNDHIDLFFTDSTGKLIHMWAGGKTNWQYHKKILLTGVTSDPVAVRFGNDIDVYCFNMNNLLVHLYCPGKENTYNCTILNIFSDFPASLFALRTSQSSIDLYYYTSGKLGHCSAGDHNNWKYEAETLDVAGSLLKGGKIEAIREGNSIDVFYFNEEKMICQVYAGDYCKWKYQSKGAIVNTQSNDFSVIRSGNDIDLYFVGFDSNVYHTFCNVNTNWAWQQPVCVAESAKKCIKAIRPYAKAIDFYFIGVDSQLKHFFIGEGTANQWLNYSQGVIKPVLHWEILSKLDPPPSHLGGGYHAEVFLVKEGTLKYIVKKFKTNNIEVIMSEMKVLDKLMPMWPGLCPAILHENNAICGFAMKFFKGTTLNDAIQDVDNILNTSLRMRVKVVRELGRIVSKMQKLGICHADLHSKNVLIYQPNKAESRFRLHIIDFGNSIIFEQNSSTYSGLTGWKFMKPIEARTSPFNPMGVNACQFGRLAMQILLLTPVSSYDSIPESPAAELKELEKEFPQSLIEVLKIATHDDPKQRLSSLSTSLLNKIRLQQKDSAQKIEDNERPAPIQLGHRLKNLAYVNEYESPGDPFYVIGHQANSEQEFMLYMRQGANAVEADLEFDKNGMPSRWKHPKPSEKTIFPNKQNPESGLEVPQGDADFETHCKLIAGYNLALLVIDSKIKNAPLVEAGTNIIVFLDRFLFGKGFKGNVVIGCAAIKHVSYIKAAYERSCQSENHGKYFFTIDGENHFDNVMEALSFISHRKVYGTGNSILVPKTYYKSVTDSVNAKANGKHGMTYIWTIDRNKSMRKYLELGVDGIMTNCPRKVKDLLHEYNKRLAENHESLLPAGIVEDIS